MALFLSRWRLGVFLGLGLVLLFGACQGPLRAHTKTFLFLAQQLPQVPVRPLHLISRAPTHQRLRLESDNGPIVADLFVHTPWIGSAQPASQPALVIAMGVKLSDQDRPILLEFADTLARLGFVVLFPRLEVLDQGVTLPEEPSTFVLGVRHLQDGVRGVDPERISLLGISIGASTALVAASDPAIADDVHAMIFFGGFYDVFDYLSSLASQTMVVEGEVVAWEVEPDAIGHMRQILEAKHATALLSAFDADSRADADHRVRSAPDSERNELRRFSPASHASLARAPLFVMHDRGDRYVPYVESLKLRRAVPPERVEAFLLSSLFQHAQFKSALNWEVVSDLAALYAFVTHALSAMES